MFREMIIIIIITIIIIIIISKKKQSFCNFHKKDDSPSTAM